MGSAIKKIGKAAGGLVKGTLGGAATSALLGGKSGGGGGSRVPAVNTSSTQKTLTSDIKTGQEILGKDYSEGSLGRLETGVSSDMQAVIDARKAALGGLSSEENQALRERASQEIDQGAQTSLRQLRALQGATGRRGGAASSQQASILQAGQAAKANAERDLLIQNVNQKQQALSNLEGTLTATEGQSRENELFNIDQANKELQARQASGLGYAQLAATERASQRGVGIAQANVAASRSGGKK